MATEKYPATAIGIYFTAVHLGVFAVAHTFNGLMALLLLPYRPAGIIWVGIGGYDNWVSTAVLAAILTLSLLAILYMMYPFGKSGYRKRTYVIIMVVLIFIIHPLAFYIFSLFQTNYFTSNMIPTDQLMATFPVSSLAFVVIGALIDKIVMKRVAAAKK